jgi:hypothetical protein
MTHQRLRARACGLLVVAGLSFASLQADAATPLADSLKGDAKASFDAGNLLYENHDYAGAATKYRAAYASSHDARLLWNMATCEKELHHYARTASLVERFLREAKPLVSPEFVGQAKATLEALRSLYSPVSLTVVPAGTHVLVDGEDVGEAPFSAPVPVDLGKHIVRAEHPGFVPSETPIDVAGQSPMSLELTLKSIADQASPTGNTTEPPPTGDGHKRWSTGRIVTVSALSAGAVVGGVLFFVFHGKAQTNVDDAKALLNGGSCLGVTSPECTKAASLKDDRDSNVTLSSVSLIAGGAFAAGAVATAFLWPKGSSESARLTPMVAPGYGGASFSGKF